MSPIELGLGQVLENLDMALPRGGVITGRVTDDLGDAAAQVLVVLLRRTISEGQLRLTVLGRPSETDDLGTFRFAGLSSGTYYVATAAHGGDGAASGEGLALAQTYFPGTASAADAEPVPLRAGQERTGVNFALVASRAVSVSGMAIDSSGRPLGMAAISLTQSSFGTSRVRSQAAQADGRFSIADVAPGDYTLSARGRASDSGEEEFAVTRITAAGADIDGVVLAGGPGGRVIGRIEFDEGVTPAFSPASLSVRMDGGGTAASAVVRSDWTFDLRNVWPGRNALTLHALPPAWTVRGMFAGGREIPDGTLDVSSNETLPGVVIALSNRPTVLSGTVRDEKGRVAGDCTVVVFAQDRARWSASGRSIATAALDPRGQYRIAGLQPGQYFAIGVEYADEGDEYDPRFLERWRLRATPVELVEGKPVTLDLTLVRIEG